MNFNGNRIYVFETISPNQSIELQTRLFLYGIQWDPLFTENNELTRPIHTSNRFLIVSHNRLSLSPSLRIQHRLRRVRTHIDTADFLIYEELLESLRPNTT